MAEPERQLNTARRSQVVDADYVLQSEEPNLPRVHPEEGGGRAVSAAAFAAAALVVFALVAAVRGAGSGQTEAALRSAGAVMDAASVELGPRPDRDLEDSSGLGLEAETVSPAVAAYYSMKDCPAVPGAQVCDVDRSGAAALAGVEPGDVITALGEREIRTAGELFDAAGACAPGEAVPLTVYRGGEYLTLLVMLPPER